VHETAFESCIVHDIVDMKLFELYQVGSINAESLSQWKVINSYPRRSQGIQVSTLVAGPYPSAFNT
jgi:hypothetical protein